jgi:PhzF family phenazine biosynthesis protein
VRLGGDWLRLELGAGVIPVVGQGARWTLSANKPSWRECDLSRAQLATMLGLSLEDVAERPLWVSTGREQLIIPLSSLEAVRRARPVPQAFEAVRSVDGQGMAYVFASSAPGQVLSRFFFPQDAALIEDPATGSACANLGGWWQALQRELPCDLTISQGEQIGRPSTLYLSVSAGGEIRVGGDVIELGRGSIALTES